MAKLLTPEQADAAGYDVNKQPEEFRLMSLSTKHVDGDDRRVHWALSGEHPQIISVDRGYGWFAHVNRCLSPEEYRELLLADSTPQSVIDVLVKANELRFDYVLLDADAPCYAGLPIYAW